jgi:hypothetical protein
MGSHDASYDSATAEAAPPLRHPRTTQLVIGTTQFLVLLDSLMVAVALPVSTETWRCPPPSCHGWSTPTPWP